MYVADAQFGKDVTWVGFQGLFVRLDCAIEITHVAEMHC